ncbi:hypothetical protein BD410DRAFT_689829, partial [Rickenella mellea]
TPYQLATGKNFELGELPEWGAKVWVKVENGGKLEPRAKIGRWVGFSAESKGHRVYWPERSIVTVERNIKFDEHVPTSNADESEPADDPPQPMQAPPDAPDPLENFEEQQAPEGRPQRVRKPSQYIRNLESGEGSTTGRRNAPLLPKGMQPP